MKKITALLSILTIGATALQGAPIQKKALFSADNGEGCTGPTCTTRSSNSSDGSSLNSFDYPTYVELSTGFGYTLSNTKFKDAGDGVSSNGTKFPMLPINAAFGAVIQDQFRVELAINWGYFFRQKIASINTTEDQGFKGDVKGNVWELGFMLNGYYDMPIDEQMDGFVGAGIGLNHAKLSIRAKGVNNKSEGIDQKKDESETQFAAQIMGGILYHFDDNLSFVSKLGFKWVPTKECSGVDVALTRIFVNVGVQYYF